ncbi:hypothetical protein BRADI_2g30373v3 [Brachypodium distachyon]|uniref:Uncharacterized protein n=1 Tax=Brachypodium distachyon TaxID=15368 RepID=A0A2K2DB61_BRADI|nr:hypothetical protein BRADI_2g30373v3 [Brachypodium distachyon]
MGTITQLLHRDTLGLENPLISLKPNMPPSQRNKRPKAITVNRRVATLVLIQPPIHERARREMRKNMDLDISFGEDSSPELRSEGAPCKEVGHRLWRSTAHLANGVVSDTFQSKPICGEASFLGNNPGEEFDFGRDLDSPDQRCSRGESSP